MASCGRVHMYEIRELRRRADLSQRQCAELLHVPVESFRTWDSGRRSVPTRVLHRARTIVADHARQMELLPLRQLAVELGVHVRTLQAAARTGRLSAQFSTRSVFGRPHRMASRMDGAAFMRTHYRRFAGQQVCPAPLTSVPPDYDAQLKQLRRRLRLTQGGLARSVGAAGKAVVYQWESKKRTPSPVYWEKIEQLAKT